MDNMTNNMIVATALALYKYNASVMERATKIYDHFKGNCAELEDLVFTLHNYQGSEVTALPYPSAKVYVEHAMERYASEAMERIIISEQV